MGTRTLDDFRTRLQRLSTERGIGNDRLDSHINAAYNEIATADKLWFPSRMEKYSFVTVDGTAAYDLPTDVEEVIAVVDETNDRRLVFLEIKDYYAKNPDEENEGEPTHWARDGECIYLWPTPDTDDESFSLHYVEEIVELSDSTDTTILAAKWDHAIMLMAAHYFLLEVGDTERSEAYFGRVMGYIRSRKEPRDYERQTAAGGLNVAHSFADLVDQET